VLEHGHDRGVEGSESAFNTVSNRGDGSDCLLLHNAHTTGKKLPQFPQEPHQVRLKHLLLAIFGKINDSGSSV
jgi:hypothetical protein